ncbi:MAG: GntR family transcriptional regulator [Eggerthellales bacterium]|nr:GntR family transcriptional regulator [Eggerthellales bacterium]
MFPFEVDQNSDAPIWLQLRQRLIYLIDTGYFKPGDQLPTVRGLATEVSINYNTVNKAYLSLAADGYIESTRGRGAFVADLYDEDQDIGKEADTVLDDCINTCLCLGMSLEDISSRMARRIARFKRENSAEADPDNLVHLDRTPQSRRHTGA